MRKAKIAFLYVFMALLFPTFVFANGFQINEQGAKALGMGGAFVAQANDPSALYFNPAGITQLERAHLSLGVSPITPRASFESDVTGKTTDADVNTFFIPNFYYTMKNTEKISTGLAVFSNYGLATEWPENWEGRYVTGGTKAEIITMTINPNIAYKINDKISVAAGVDIQNMDITLKNKLAMLPYNGSILMLNSDGDSKLTADDWAYGWNAAVHYKITENWKAGISYRSEIKHEIKDGTAELSLPSGYLIGSGPVPAMNIQKTGSADITLPEILYLGTSYEIGKFTFELDGQWTGWSSYDELKIEFEDGSQQVSPKNWEDVWAIRLGAQYSVNKMLDLRAGIIRDYSPIPDDTVDPLVPSGDRWLYAVGLGFNFHRLTIDVAYNYLDDENREFDNEVGKKAPYGYVAPELTGEFKDIDAHIFGVNVSYKF
ncbi:OmpP1/FadL family transporter [Flexistipes sp.]|uniref:OmpP1/FadL family transporter n=1 Tax=Flexistipes sp. TaxID=3088135 RepID=UPI002E1B2E22|nr:outer membrane protein transport protein [Flexistipes sp.]